jgi:hypothetical protein
MLRVGMFAADVDAVTVPSWLVGENHPRLTADGSRDGGTLLLTAGELRRKVPHAGDESYPFQRIHDAFATLTGRHAAIMQRSIYVVIDIQVRD